MSYVALRIIKPTLTELFSGFCEKDVHVSPKEDEEKDRPKLISNFARWVKQTTTNDKEELMQSINEPPRGKTNNVVSEQVRHKPTCTSTEAG